MAKRKRGKPVSMQMVKFQPVQRLIIASNPQKEQRKPRVHALQPPGSLLHTITHTFHSVYNVLGVAR